MVEVIQHQRTNDHTTITQRTFTINTDNSVTLKYQMTRSIKQINGNNLPIQFI